jgi:hypothetical protein
MTVPQPDGPAVPRSAGASFRAGVGSDDFFLGSAVPFRLPPSRVSSLICTANRETARGYLSTRAHCPSRHLFSSGSHHLVSECSDNYVRFSVAARFRFFYFSAVFQKHSFMSLDFPRLPLIQEELTPRGTSAKKWRCAAIEKTGKRASCKRQTLTQGVHSWRRRSVPK